MERGRGCERGLGKSTARKILTQRWVFRATNSSGLRDQRYAFCVVFLALMGAADASLIRPVLDFRPTERWPSGRRRTPGKCVYGNVSRVRIPPSPPPNKKGHLEGGLFYCAAARLKPRLISGLALGIWQVVKHRLKNKRAGTLARD